MISDLPGIEGIRAVLLFMVIHSESDDIDALRSDIPVCPRLAIFSLSQKLSPKSASLLLFSSESFISEDDRLI